MCGLTNTQIAGKIDTQVRYRTPVPKPHPKNCREGDSMRRAKIAIPDEFELKTLDDFLSLIFDSEGEASERRIGLAKTLLERLRVKRETYVEDWLEIVLEYLDDQEMLEEYHNMLKEFDEGKLSKTAINKHFRQRLKEKGYPIYALEKDWSVVKKTLMSLKLISKTSNRLNLARDYTFADGLNDLIKFYSKWRAGEI